MDKIVAQKEKTLWHENSNCKQTAENQLTKKSKPTSDKCKQIAQIVNKQLTSVNK